MWNVSGITGAAPVWIEMMDFLHRDVPSIKREALPGLVRKKIEFSQGIPASREEWFIRGTEPNLSDQRVGQFNQRIVYPPSGTVIALDPDIPPELQKVFFVSQTDGNGSKWILNGSSISPVGRTIAWVPKVGEYKLVIADQEERIIDTVYFEVRGSREE
jgi:penicillin-binding protein 1C